VKYYGIFDEDGKLARLKLYTSLGVAKNVLSRVYNHKGWEVKEVRTITTTPTPTRTLDLRRQTFEHRNWNTDTTETVEIRPAIPVVDLVTDANIVRVHVEGNIEYLDRNTRIY
jgi:hypothetical protein